MPMLLLLPSGVQRGGCFQGRKFQVVWGDIKLDQWPAGLLLMSLLQTNICIRRDIRTIITAGWEPFLRRSDLISVWSAPSLSTCECQNMTVLSWKQDSQLIFQTSGVFSSSFNVVLKDWVFPLTLRTVMTSGLLVFYLLNSFRNCIQ